MSRLVKNVDLSPVYLMNEKSVNPEVTLELGEIFEKLYDYEDAEENDLLMFLPCKLGGTLFSILYERGHDEIIEVEVKEISIGYYLSKKLITIKAENKMRRGLVYQFQEDDFGVILFRSMEEAEKKLKEMEG